MALCVHVSELYVTQSVTQEFVESKGSYRRLLSQGKGLHFTLRSLVPLKGFKQVCSIFRFVFFMGYWDAVNTEVWKNC
jgi:hypothetical protein